MVWSHSILRRSGSKAQDVCLGLEELEGKDMTLIFSDVDINNKVDNDVIFLKSMLLKEDKANNTMNLE